MSINQIIPVLILVEVIIILLFFLIVLSRKIFIYFEDKRIAIQRAEISRLLNEYIIHDKPFPLKQELKAPSCRKILLTTLEAYDRRFNGEDWKRLRKDVAEHYLLPTARKWAKSLFWTKRNFAARCFACAPFMEDETEIITLMDDPIFLVRSIAAVAAIQLEIKDAVIKVIRHMSVTPGYAHFFYRDVLVQGSAQVFQWVEELASEEKDPSIHLSCLEVLASKTMEIRQPFLKEDLKSDNLKIRLAAIKSYTYSPQYDHTDILFKFLQDPNVRIRTEAIRGLEFILTEQSYVELGKALKDDLWVVRFQAANTLKKMGRKGLDILNEQDRIKNKEAYEVAQFVLQTP